MTVNLNLMILRVLRPFLAGFLVLLAGQFVRDLPTGPASDGTAGPVLRVHIAAD